MDCLFLSMLSEKQFILANSFRVYSNSLPCGIIIDPESSLIGNKLTVKIDYWILQNDNQLVDQRNDKRIIAVLQKDKKLIKIDL